MGSQDSLSKVYLVFTVSIYSIAQFATAAPLFSMTVGEPSSALLQQTQRVTWLNRNFDLAMASASPINWNAPYNIGWQLKPWQTWASLSKSRNLHYTAHMLSPGETLEQCAAGKLDSRWIPLANSLMSYGFNKAIIRVGHEFSGNWYPWTAKGKESLFVQCYRRIVNVLRKTQPAAQWKFDWNPIPGTSSTMLNATYPGDSYVDYISTDVYDVWYTSNTYPFPTGCNTTCRLDRQKRNWIAIKSNLDRIRNFSQLRKKPMAIPEWGVWDEKYTYGAGGDNPYFIEQMYNYIHAPINNIAYHSYFELASDGDHRLYGDSKNPSLFPNSSATFKKLFGYSLSLENSSLSDNQPSAGFPLTLSAQVKSNNSLDNTITTFYYTDINGRLAGSYAIKGSFKKNQIVQLDTLGYKLPSTLPVGSYSVSMTIHNSDYSKQLFYRGNIQKFKVVKDYDVNHVIVTSKTSISFNLVTNYDINDANITVFYYDSKGSLINSSTQKMNLVRHTPVEISWHNHRLPASISTGVYTYALSIHNSNWSKLLYFNGRLSHFSIQ